MRLAVFSTLAAAALLATPALAQSSNQDGAQPQGQTKSSAQPMTQARAMGKDQLRKSLEQAGFTNVAVVDATYLVRALGPHGNRVTMLIDPPAAGAASGGGMPTDGGGQGQESSTKQ